MSNDSKDTVAFDIVPKIDPARWASDIKTKLDPTVDKAGRSLGSTLSAGIRTGFKATDIARAIADSQPAARVKATEVGGKVGSALSSGVKQGFKASDVARAVADSQPEARAKATEVGAKVGDAYGTGIKRSLSVALKDLPVASIKAGVDTGSVDRVKAKLDTLAKDRTARVKVDAETAGADAKLKVTGEEADKVDRKRPNVKVTADTSQAQGSLVALGWAVAGLAATPLVAPLAAGLGGLAAGFGAAAAGAAGLAAVAIPGIHHIQAALQAQQAAQTAVTTATAHGQSAAITAALAADQGKLQALSMVGAQAGLTAALQTERQAELAVTVARADARRQLQDLTNAVKDAALAQRGGALSVQQARLDLDKVLSNPASSNLARQQAQLTYDQAVQQQSEQKLTLNRAVTDKKVADKAGVDGSKLVVAAQQQLSNAMQGVAAAQRAITAQTIADRDAKLQAAQSVTALQSANLALAASMAKLSPAERGLAKDWQSFSKAYKDWTISLQPSVFPVLAGGMDLVKAQLHTFDPLIRGSAAAFRILEGDAKNALAGPFWKSFVADVSTAAPKAIIGLGQTAGHVFMGMAGVMKAFLPYTTDIIGAVDHMAARFDTWGRSLGASSGFAAFMDTAKRDAPLVAKDLRDIGGAALELFKAAYPLGRLELQVIGPLVQGIGALAKFAPGLVELGAAIYGVVKVNQQLQLVGLTKGFLGLGAAEAAAATGAAGAGVKLRAFGGMMMGVEAEAVTTKTALLGLGLAAGIALAAVFVPVAMQKFHDWESGTVQSTDDLTTSLTRLGKTGEWGGALAQQFKVSFQESLSGTKSVDEFVGAVRSIADPSLANYVQHGMQTAFQWVPGMTTSLQEAHNKIGAMDDALAKMARGGQTLQAAAAFAQLAQKLRDAGVSTGDIIKLFPHYSGLVGDATFKNQLLTDQINAQNAALSRNAQAFMDSETEIINFDGALAQGDAALKTNGKQFWGHSAAAEANRLAVLNAAGVLQGYTDNLVTNGKMTDANRAILMKQRDQLIVLAEKFGLSKDAAQAYIDKLLKIPPKAHTAITVAATGKFTMSGGILGITQPAVPGGKSLLPTNAGGGHIQGRGGPRADDLVTRISAKEFVVNAPATSRYLPWLAAINDEGNRGTTYQGKGYASGGLVLPGSQTAPVAALAGGGFGSASSASVSYDYTGDATKALAAATQGLAAGIGTMAAYAVDRTAFISQLAILAAAAGGGSGDGAKALAFAVAQLGKPYVWGATGPGSFDCSGLTMRAWEAAGKNIGRTTFDQVKAGRDGTEANALPGDLWFPEPGHVMMFAHPRSGGAQEMIEAPHTGDVVKYAPFGGGGVVRLIATPGGGGAGAAPGGSGQGVAAAQAFAQSQLGQFGWPASEMNPLTVLWNQESGWMWNALNPTSGAYGIPQSLPANKMASAGADWHNNAFTQVRWGLGYIHDRYGSPSGAEGHEKMFNWYAAGTPGGGAAPGLAWVGERGPELVHFSGGETVIPHDVSMAIAGNAGGGLAGYASGTSSSSSRSTALAEIAADLGKAFIAGLIKSAGTVKTVLGDLIKDVEKAFKGAHGTLSAKMVDYLAKESKALQSLAAKRDQLVANIAAAKVFADDTAAGARQFAGLTGLQLGTTPLPVLDAQGHVINSALYAKGNVFGAAGILGGLQQRVAQLKAYASNLAKLRKLGFSKDLISQIIAAGPDQGSQFAAALAAATPAQVKELNTAEASITSVSKDVGNQAAGAMYGAGLKAGQGVADGLKAQEKAIQAEMTRIANLIKNTLKKDLKIHSPSLVMHELGQNAGLGVAAGIEASLEQVRMSSTRMSALIASPNIQIAPEVASGRSGGGLSFGDLHVHGVNDKPTKQAIGDALHDTWVLHRMMIPS